MIRHDFYYKYEFERPQDKSLFHVFVKQSKSGDWHAMYPDYNFDYLQLFKENKLDFCEVGSEICEDSVYITIDNVKFTKTNKICTYTVAAAIHALVHRLTEEKTITEKTDVNGQVLIVSKSPCKAFNCYNRAFEMNGFSMNEDCKLQANSISAVDVETDEEYLFEYKRVQKKLQQRLRTCTHDNICEERLADLEEINHRNLIQISRPTSRRVESSDE